MATNKVINIDVKVDSNIDATTKDIDQLNDGIKDTTKSTNELEKSQNKLGTTMKSSGKSILDNGGAVGLLNELTGGLASTVKDAVEALDLFKTTNVETTVAVEAQVVATEAQVIATTEATVATEGMTIAQKALNLAAKANPYAALLVIFTAIIAIASEFISKQNETAKAVNTATGEILKSERAVNDLKDSIEESASSNQRSNEIEILRAKALGASTKEIRELIKAQNEKAVSDAVLTRTDAYNKAVEASNAYTKALISDNDDLIKRAKANYDIAQKISDDAAATVPVARDNLTKAVLENQIEENKELKTLGEKQIKDKKAQLAANKELNDAFLELTSETAVLTPTAQEEELIDFRNGLQVLTNDVEIANKVQTQSEVDKFKITTGLIDEGIANKEADSKVDEEKAKAREAHFAAGSAQLKNAAALLGESTDAGKAAAIAATTIDTYQAATAAYGSLAGIPIVGPALGAVAAGIAVASGLANVKKIISVKTPKGGSTGGAPSGGNSFSSPPLVPQTNLFGSSNNLNTAVNKTTEVGQNQSFTVKAVVSETEITNSQAFISKVKNSASI